MGKMGRRHDIVCGTSEKIGTDVGVNTCIANFSLQIPFEFVTAFLPLHSLGGTITLIPPTEKLRLMAYIVVEGRLHMGSCPLFLKSKENCDVFYGTGRFEVQRSLESLSCRRYIQVRNLRHKDGKSVAPGHTVSKWWDKNLLKKKDFNYTHAVNAVT